ncbi:DUF3795 domain-containing protein [Extibacter muris]|uniref:DUF3795 domain-containing protein n=1 Tax=Extibacter muris TaxID=1796622 RepID=UPI001D082D4F|nr:DUF3795 domain-containing protein [Extibacter muris]MCB6203743.1 DUF3795 domain-containing protein [Extibacter muris]MCQ4665485.1 DUF3795 domain-containing protein [Extibacter muris]MCQ4694864.1 DUF3795 domain-containing protein [Extibacter muris]
MKDFKRDNLLLSLCGLNCGLCPMHLGGYCPGCGGGEGNQACKIAKCSMSRDKVEYCYECGDYPCEKYEGIDEFDSFITHRNMRKDLLKAKEVGVDCYVAEQEEKVRLLRFLLENYNDGRRKNLFCVAVNLLELPDIKAIVERAEALAQSERFTLKEKAACIVQLLREHADGQGIELKLIKKPSKK